MDKLTSSNLKWHRNILERISSHKKIFYLAVIMILIIGISLTVFLSSQKDLRESRSRADLSQDISTLTQRLVSGKESDKNKIEIAIQRKPLLKKIGRVSPDNFLLNTISPEIRSTLPPEAQKAIERKVEITGSLIEKVNDEETTAPTDLAPSLILQTVNPDGSPANSYNLFLTEDFSPAIGEKVKVTGYLIDKLLIPIAIDPVPLTKLDTENKLAINDVSKAVLGVSTIGNKRIAVISVTFSQPGYSESNFTRQQLADIYFTGNVSTAKYLKRASLGKLSFNGDVNDVYEVRIDSKYSRADVCDVYETDPDRGVGFSKDLIDKAKSQASQRGINWGNYEFIGFFFPFARGLCDGGPSGDEPAWDTAIARGVGNRDYGAKPYHFVNGDYCKHISGMCSSQYHYAGLVAHEIGHNLGLSHANGLRCTSDGTSGGTPKTIGSYRDCRSFTYSDRFDVIGGAWTYRPYFSASNQNLFLNYMPDANKKIVTRDNVSPNGIYTLYSSSEPRTGVTQFIRVPRAVNRGAYYIEYRDKEFPAIENYPTSVFDGAIIRLSEVPPFKLKNTDGEWQNRPEQTYLIDMRNNRKSSWYDFIHPNLVDGQTFTDNINKINIQQITHDGIAGKVQLKITFGSPPCELNNPSLSIPERRKSNFAGSETNYQITIVNNNSSACSNALFDLSSTTVPGWNVRFSENGINLASGARKTLTLRLTSPGTATQDGNPYTFEISATNRSNTSYRLTKTIRHDIQTPLPTPTNPTPTNPTPPPSKIQSMIIYPLEDTYVNRDNPGANFGRTNNLWADGVPLRRAYIRFDLSSLRNKKVKEVSLKIKVSEVKYSASKKEIGVTIEGNSSWSEGSMTFNNRPKNLSSRIGVIDNPRRGEIKTVDLTKDLSSAKGRITLSLETDVENSDGAAFYSSDSGEYKPRLEVKYTD